MRFVSKAFLLLLITNTYNFQIINHRKSSLMAEKRYKSYYSSPFISFKTAVKPQITLQSTIVTTKFSTELLTQELTPSSSLQTTSQQITATSSLKMIPQEIATLQEPPKKVVIPTSTLNTINTTSDGVTGTNMTKYIADSDNDPNLKCKMYCTELECKYKDFRYHNYKFNCEAICPNISNTPATVNQVEAHKMCKAYNATLLEIETCSKLNCIITYIAQAYKFMQTQTFWTGGRVGGCAARYTWCPSGRLVSKYLKWQIGQPSHDNISDICITVERNTSPKYKDGLDDQPCNKLQTFICDVPDT